MSHLLEFCRSSPLPPGITSPPYVVFGIRGINITSSLPPRIPLKLVLHFAPALRKWVLPAPDSACLPRIDAEQSLRTPYIGINILAPIDVVGLGWIVVHMMHLSGCVLRNDSFKVHPDLDTSLAVHHTWLALELPIEGLQGLHMHIQAQLTIGSSPVRLWDMCTLWDAFPHDSAIVKAMGLNFIEALVGLKYTLYESLDILTWLQSTSELLVFFEGLQRAVPGFLDGTIDAVNTLTGVEDKKKTAGTGYQTVDKKAGKEAKAAVAQQVRTHVDIMERRATRKVSPQERQERETSDFQAMQSRLRRTKSDDSLRSVNTAIWDPQQVEEVQDAIVNDDMHDPGNYSGGSFSAELARSLASIKLRREARRLKSESSNDVLAVESTSAKLQEHSIEEQPVLKRSSCLARHRRSSSTSTQGKENGLSITELEKRIQALKSKQRSSTPHLEDAVVGNDMEYIAQARRPRLRRKTGLVARPADSPVSADAGQDEGDDK